MSARAGIAAAVRAWHKLAATLTDAQVILADAKGPRPPLPYLTVKVTVAGVHTGRAEILDDLDEDDAPTVAVRQSYRGTVSVQGFGAGAETWLEQAAIALDLPAVRALVDAAGATFEPLGDGRDLSGLIDTEIEPRYLREYTVTYALASDPVSLVPSTQVLVDDFTFTSRDGDPSPRTFDIEIIDEESP